MARQSTSPRRAPKDTGRRGGKKKVCVFCKDHTEWVDYKDVNLLRRFMSERGKIRARRVSGNCAQHQRDVAVAIKTARELALLPYTQRTVAERTGGRGGRGPGGGGRGGPREDAELRIPQDEAPAPDDPSVGDDRVVADVAEAADEPGAPEDD
jgi:small subunit ribosomal protein S18